MPPAATTIRKAQKADIGSCGRIMYEAFTKVAERHGFPADVPTLEFGVSLAGFVINHPSFFGLVADVDGKVVGSSFLDERDRIRSVLVITVDPHFQRAGVGRRLMEGLLERGRGSLGIRLVQDPHNPAALSLYTSLGFDIKELLALVTGRLKDRLDGQVEVRRLREPDVAECAALCRGVHGVDRTNELMDAINFHSPHVAIRNGRVRGYATDLSTWQVAHGVAETEKDMQDLLLGISQASSTPLSFLFPTGQSALFRWCLREGLRVVKPMALMAMGMYREPQGFFFPSVAY